MTAAAFSNHDDKVFTASTEDCMEHGISQVDATPVATASSTPSKTKTSYTAMIAAGLLLVATIGVACSRQASQTNVDIASTSSSSSTSVRRLQRKGLTVAAYYYPWHGSNFHNGDGFLRQDLEPQQLPTLGLYDDTKPETIQQHLDWSRQANIDVWVTSWWSPNGLVDTTTKDTILKHADIGDMKIALHYETLGRVRQSEGFDTKRVAPDMKYICETYFDHPNYYTINGRPVMWMYLTRYMESSGKIEEVAALMRSAVNKCGKNLYIIGDHTFSSAPDAGDVFMPFKFLDAVTNYDLYGGMKAPTPYAGEAIVDKYYDNQALWRERAAEHGCGYVSSAAPGYNDRGVRLDADHRALSRQLNEGDDEGSLFRYALDRARDIVDESADNLVIINSFNEWHEDTQLEPVDETDEGTSIPEELTNGVSYKGYGELYLDILSEKTLGYLPPSFKSSRAFLSS